jgi:hypothetical protein
MKIGELRALLAQYTEQRLRLIIAEMYKAIPKSVREEKEIDDILTHPEELLKPKVHRKKAEAQPRMEELKNEADQFIEYAYQQYYLTPNSHVPKKERPKWRFIVKRLHKSILASAVDEANVPIASELLTKLYTMLCYSCEYTLFSAYDTFESIGIEQTTFFGNVLELKFRHESPMEFARNSIRLIVDHSLNRYTLHSDLMEIALHYLQSLDITELAIQICDELIADTRRQPVSKKSTWMGDVEYRKRRKLNNLVEMAFLCYGELQDFEQGVEYFKANYLETEPEVKLYILLRFLFLFQQEELFVQEYERALKEKIKPRKQLVKLYETVKATGEFPEFFD